MATDSAGSSGLPTGRADLPLTPGIGPLGKKWSLLILRELARLGDPTFSELLEVHPQLSKRLLSLRLADLQHGRYVEKGRSSTTPGRAVYRLTAKGVDALPVLVAFSRLVREYGEGVARVQRDGIDASEICKEHPELRSSPGRIGGMPDDAPARPASRKERALKDRCEKCGTPLPAEASAWTCSYACTWCPACAEGFHWTCPNCQGELRPRRP